MVYRIYVEKKEGFRQEAESIRRDIKESLGLDVPSLRLINRYDVENIPEPLFSRAVREVFSEPPVDSIYAVLPEAEHAIAICYLPGQFDQRARSAEECIGFLSPGSKAKVRSCRVFLLDGIAKEEKDRIKDFLINPVEAMEDRLDEFDTLEEENYAPSCVERLDGFITMEESELVQFIASRSLAMDTADLALFQSYFRSIGRDPTITELRVCDTYWSDHCRHTTFLTELDDVSFEDSSAEETYRRYLEIRRELGRDDRPVTLMDIATIGAKYLKSKGKLSAIDESEEINACSIRIDAEIDGRNVPYLLMFKNETHNHPTEIEPFGGAATCIGGAIRDPLSGRAYVYQAARISGSGDILAPFEKTLPGKLSQKKIGVASAAGNSSYGNQIGLATGMVDEIYHPGYMAKHMELGAVVAAVPLSNVKRERPAPGDVVILLGGRTGRDGIGGATGSSRKHGTKSLSTCSAEVQKGNAPEERKLQRLFRNAEAAGMIKRCNDFGAGGVCVAIGELADGLSIDLDRIKKKYQGLDGTELAISESQERMAIVVDRRNEARFLELARNENLEAVTVAVVTAEPVLSMRWNGNEIVHIDRSFLDTNGAGRKTSATVERPKDFTYPKMDVESALGTLPLASRQGLSERFDSTIGRGTVLMPFGGIRQKTPAKAMCALIPVLEGDCRTASVFSYGFEPYLSDSNPYRGAYDAVVESIAKLVATGAGRKGIYLSLQEYFGKPGSEPKRWGRPLAALLGALQAQLDFEVAAIGGKDSMSGSFENLDVPNTLVSFAINVVDRDRVISPEFKKAGSGIYLMDAERYTKEYFDHAAAEFFEKKVLSVSTVKNSDVTSEIAKMCFGSGIGAKVEEGLVAGCGAFIIESDVPIDGARKIGCTIEEETLDGRSLDNLLKVYESTLDGVYPLYGPETDAPVRTITSLKTSCAERVAHSARPSVLIPVFPGTNCEYDAAKAFSEAGAEPRIFVVGNLDDDMLRQSVDLFARTLDKCQMLFIPGGFSGGDEPDGSGKFITSFMRNPAVRQSIEKLLGTRGGLVGGICNGFQALIKLGLVPFGEFRDLEDESPTLTFNTIGRHVSHLVRTRVCSTLSPWLSRYSPGEMEFVPVSHGEGRLSISPALAEKLALSGQISTQYVDADGIATMDPRCNPNGSTYAIEALSSPDGRVFGRMGHIERCADGLYRNVAPGSSLRFFSGAVDFFK